MASQPVPRASGFGKRPAPVATLLLVAAAVAPSLRGVRSFFVGDDFDFLVLVRRMRGFGEPLRLSFWGEWEPLWTLDFYRDWRIWGLSPAGYHLASLVWVLAAALALRWLVARLWPGAAIAPWAAALLFATHPLHDEAVTYIAARGHPMAVGLSLLAVTCWVRCREPRSRRRVGWGATALVLALGAALAKETALVLPAWIVALEWGVRGGLRLDRLGRALRAGLLFLLPCAAYGGLRWAVVGLGSDKLQGPDGGLVGLLDSGVDHAPEYALAGGLPLPFAFFDEPALVGLRPLGWTVLLGVVLVGVVATARRWRTDGRASTAVGLYWTGLTIAAVGLLPVFWADLGLRRRYFHAPAVGVALIGAVVLQWIATRRPRAAGALLALLAVGGAAGLWQRNGLYAEAGDITRRLFEQASASATASGGGKRRVMLITLPRYAGGDGFSGAYVLHRTDARSALRLAGLDADLSAALACDFAETYLAEVAFASARTLEVTVRFRSRRAYEAAKRRDPDDDPFGDLVASVERSADDSALLLRYRVGLAAGFPRGPSDDLYVFSEGRFGRLPPPPDP
jgi:hypothetical protein